MVIMFTCLLVAPSSTTTSSRLDVNTNTPIILATVFQQRVKQIDTLRVPILLRKSIVLSVCLLLFLNLMMMFFERWERVSSVTDFNPHSTLYDVTLLIIFLNVYCSLFAIVLLYGGVGQLLVVSILPVLLRSSQ